MNGHHHKYFSVDIAFYNYYVTMYNEPMMPSVVKNSWNWNFANFRDLVKNFAMFAEKNLCQSLFLSCNFIKKETLAQRFSCEVSKIFKNPFFTEHLWITTDIL